jgi:predicted metal-binding protein
MGGDERENLCSKFGATFSQFILTPRRCQGCNNVTVDVCSAPDWGRLYFINIFSSPLLTNLI